MPILILILLIVLVANIGFWDTLQAVFGALGVVILFFLILAGLAAAIGAYAWSRLRKRF